MTLDTHTFEALTRTRTIDLTTYGRRSGKPTRIEIWWFHVQDRFVITGTPGPRDWYANVLANPAVVIHTNDHDYRGLAVPITDPTFREAVFTDPQISWYSTQAQLDDLVARAPMIEIRL